MKKSKLPPKPRFHERTARAVRYLLPAEERPYISLSDTGTILSIKLRLEKRLGLMDKMRMDETAWLKAMLPQLKRYQLTRAKARLVLRAEAVYHQQTVQESGRFGQ